MAGADIDATLAWDRTVGNPTIVVADLDTGYAFDHPDLAPVAWTNADEAPGNDLDDDGNGYVDDWRGWDAFEGDNDPTDTNGSALRRPWRAHRRNDRRQGRKRDRRHGAAQDVRIMPVRVLGPFGGSPR